MSRNNRNRVVEAMRPFTERFMPDKRLQAMQNEADAIAGMAVTASEAAAIQVAENEGMPEPIGKVESCEVVGGVLHVTGKLTDKQMIAMLEDQNRMSLMGTLTPEEQEALRIKRESAPDRCPRCGMGVAHGRGYVIASDRCNGCGYRGKRKPA